MRAVITVTAETAPELAAARTQVEVLAQQSHLEVQPLYGEHDQGWAIGALPLARRPR